MSYHLLLTGATGLLGRYLLRDLLTDGVSVAAVVRPSRRQSAQDRIEALMTTWEDKLGRPLPRPFVLEGNISEPDLGLDSVGVNWVREHCDAVLHNAASLTFQSTDPQGEPWRSNVQGTQSVLDLCQKAGIRDFHHVSTAYVCGLRHGRILESELDVGQKMGNDYEQSKVQAEKMVRSADFLSPPTVFRPAIIIGDSETGFTTTFHGFYAALHLATALTKSLQADETGQLGAQPARLTLDGHESKNLVPVDWVSAVISHIVQSPEHHGQTYHLTPRHPVTARLVRDVLEEANGFYGTRFAGSGASLTDPTEAEQLFYEHIRVYNSYWRDDPTFDHSNTTDAAPHLPCPHVDREMLLKMARVAIGMNFKWKDVPVREATEVHS